MIVHSDPLHLRVFLSSPSDVLQERALAFQVIDQLPYDPLLRGKITVEVVAWDKKGAGVPVLATLTPQEAINQELPKPSECDIVIVIFWSRMGTPLPPEYTKPDGNRYLSGTEWEYEDAMQAAKRSTKHPTRPQIIIYRCTANVLLSPADSEFMAKYEQWQRVQDFFKTFTNPDGSIRQGYNPYQTPDDFREHLGIHLRHLIQKFLKTPVHTNILFQLWDKLEADLQDVFELAFNLACMDGDSVIKTKYFFAAIARLQPEPTREFLIRLPQNAFPIPINSEIPITQSLLTENPGLSECIEDSLTHLGQKISLENRLSSADVVVDLAKYGTGSSVARLRANGVTPNVIDDLVTQLKWDIISR